jgi:acetyltransferase-like isoleucine patch superfamily enzyme
MDTDFHKILDKSNKIINEDKEITIGNKVWIGCRCTILKGASIKDNIVIGANSFISGIFNGSNQIIAGNPPKILKNDIDWIP